MPKTLTTQEFIIKARNIHGDRYDYKKSVYTTARKKVIIICKVHGEFEQTPDKHLNRKQGCPKCGWENNIIKINSELRLTNKIFIERANKIHNNFYDYSKVEYISINKRVKIICPIHGEFEQIAADHIINGSGCMDCGGRKQLTQEIFLERMKDHRNYDNYDFSQAIYIKNNKKIVVYCKKCNKEFHIKPLDLFMNKGCPFCSGKHKTTNDFINECKKIFGEKYFYEKTLYKKSNKKVCITCEVHGDFYQTPNKILNRHSGCPKCSRSIFELNTGLILKKYSIEYEEQKKFDTCKNKNNLPFDFYLPKLNVLVECDGPQHGNYRYFERLGESRERALKLFANLKENDSIKNNWAKENSVKLLRIPYKYYKPKNLEQFIIDNLNLTI